MIGLNGTMRLSGRDVADWGTAMQQARTLHVVTPGGRHYQARHSSQFSSTMQVRGYGALLTTSEAFEPMECYADCIRSP
jgi:hypothetical protein